MNDDLTREELEENIKILTKNIDDVKRWKDSANKLDTLYELEEELSEFEQMLEELNNEED